MDVNMYSIDGPRTPTHIWELENDQVNFYLYINAY